MRLTPFEVAQHSFANPVVRRKERQKMAIAQSAKLGSRTSKQLQSSSYSSGGGESTRPEGEAL